MQAIHTDRVLKVSSTRYHILLAEFSMNINQDHHTGWEK